MPRMGDHTPAAARLEYATPLSWHRRRRRRVLVVLLAVALLVLGIDRYGAAGWSRVQLLYWQRQCAIHQAPPEMVVSDSSTRYIPPSWSRFRGLAGAPVRPWSPPAVVFLGERRTGNGKAVLVAATTTGQSLAPDVILVDPATLFRAPAFSIPTEVRVGLGWLSDPQTLSPPTRWFAGQPHPTDPTRFLMESVEGNQRRRIEARLDEEGTMIYFRVVDAEKSR